MLAMPQKSTAKASNDVALFGQSGSFADTKSQRLWRTLSAGKTSFYRIDKRIATNSTIIYRQRMSRLRLTSPAPAPPPKSGLMLMYTVPTIS